jgi:hypothetical protein
MHMICHDHIGPELKPFVFATMIHAIQNNIPVDLPGKNIDPIHYLKGEEIGSRFVLYLISGTHSR